MHLDISQSQHLTLLSIPSSKKRWSKQTDAQKGHGLGYRVRASASNHNRLAGNVHILKAVDKVLAVGCSSIVSRIDQNDKTTFVYWLCGFVESEGANEKVGSGYRDVFWRATHDHPISTGQLLRLDLFGQTKSLRKILQEVHHGAQLNRPDMKGQLQVARSEWNCPFPAKTLDGVQSTQNYLLARKLIQSVCSSIQTWIDLTCTVSIGFHWRFLRQAVVAKMAIHTTYKIFSKIFSFEKGQSKGIDHPASCCSCFILLQHNEKIKLPAFVYQNSGQLWHLPNSNLGLRVKICWHLSQRQGLWGPQGFLFAVKTLPRFRQPCLFQLK